MLNKYLINIITEYVGYNPNIEFIDTFEFTGAWNCLASNESLPDSFWVKYEKQLSQYMLMCVLNRNVNINFLKRNIHKINDQQWIYLCRNPNIPQSFYEQYIDMINYGKFVRIILYNYKVSFDWIHKHINIMLNKDKLEMTLKRMATRRDITEKFILEYINDFSISCWLNIMKYSNIPYLFFLTIKSKIPQQAWDYKFILYDYNYKEMNNVLKCLL